MEPTIVVLCDELGEADLSRLQHLHDELEQAAVVGPITGNEVCCTAQEVVAVCGATDEGVELGTSVAATHHDGLAPRLAYGVEQLLHEYVQQVVGTLGRAIVDALAQRRGAGGEFLNRKI